MRSAWKTLEKANATSFKPGDRLFLEGGQRFTGTLSIGEDDAGKPGKPVTVSSYGAGRATITNPSGTALKVSVCSNLRLSNLVLTGPGRTGLNGGSGMNLVWLRDSEIDNIEVSGFQKSGIILNKCVNVKVTNAYAHDNGYAGIYSEGGCDNLYIGGCRAINNPGDPTIKDNHSGSGIFISFTKNSMVEYCEASENGWDMSCPTMGPVGIWTALSDNITIQHCISHNNKTRTGSWGGGGFDLDGGTSNSTLQYNLSYENQGAGLLICAFENTTCANNTIRYNISANDGLSANAASICIVGSARQSNIRIYNNTIYNDENRSVVVGDGQMPETFLIANNIFAMRGNASFVHAIGRATVRGNIYWNYDNTGDWDGFKSLTEWRNATGNEMLDGVQVGLNQDPLLVNPGVAIKITEPAKKSSLASYKLKPESPCINAAIDLPKTINLNHGASDFYGAKLKTGTSDVGAHEKTATGR